jgi:hypothetical protein
MNDFPSPRSAVQSLRMITPLTARRPNLLVVAGMHRSGTSAIARALKTMGVELGDSTSTHSTSNFLEALARIGIHSRR